MLLLATYNKSIIANLLLILTVQKFEHLSIFDEVIRHTKNVPIFWATL